MVRTLMALVVVLLAAAGCTTTQPVVADVWRAPNGALIVERCEIHVRVIVGIPDAALQNCKRETR